ncbi:unnamed protein product [Acanthoscelides obtectus]|uniref:Uncharacterized protein n=1 Tax=Acanthoscelides obtectus TaxID=200917 RepID=A0A9P0Q9V3_ACAOB|nr:unnamed protein product [Acanthoscelides obtectus]CAK1624683.1 hypothetical protein AOBTE_LOCUS2695 [Acanthoscelides obtectus]
MRLWDFLEEHMMQGHTRWGSFRADIDSKLGAVPYRLGRGSDIEAAVESLSRDLTAAYEENCPLRKVQEKFRLLPAKRRFNEPPEMGTYQKSANRSVSYVIDYVFTK